MILNIGTLIKYGEKYDKMNNKTFIYLIFCGKI